MHLLNKKLLQVNQGNQLGRLFNAECTAFTVWWQRVIAMPLKERNIMEKYEWLNLQGWHKEKLVPIQEFNNLVNDLGIVDYPGFGYYANNTQFIACINQKRAKIYFNSFNMQDAPEGITHILWFDL